jgi:hypothetical protein
LSSHFPRKRGTFLPPPSHFHLRTAFSPLVSDPPPPHMQLTSHWTNPHLSHTILFTEQYPPPPPPFLLKTTKFTREQGFVRVPLGQCFRAICPHYSRGPPGRRNGRWGAKVVSPFPPNVKK